MTFLNTSPTVEFLRIVSAQTTSMIDRAVFKPLYEHAILEDRCFDAARFRARCEIGNVANGKYGDETQELGGSGERLYYACAAESVEYCGMC